MRLSHNGQIISSEEFSGQALLDRAMHYGDGLFETIAIHHPYQNICQHPLWRYHLDRLKLGCDRLFFTNFDELELISQINRFLENQTQTPFILKLLYTRGLSTRGYAIPTDQKPNIILYQNHWPLFPKGYFEEGILAEFSPIVLYPDPLLAGIKHLNRLPQVLAAHSLSTGCQEALLCNQTQQVIEGSKSNIFMLKNKQFMTPKLDNCGVKGVVRSWILDKLKSSQYTGIECDISKLDLLNSDGVFVCNSVMGIWPIKKLENHQFSFSNSIRWLQSEWQKELQIAA